MDPEGLDEKCSLKSEDMICGDKIVQNRKRKMCEEHCMTG
jgi:hypothetical protein